MPDYWLDSDALITPKNGPYGFDIAPGFWEFIEGKITEGSIRSPAFVYDELVEGGDELTAWAREQKSAGLFVEPDQEVQRAMTNVASFVQR